LSSKIAKVSKRQGERVTIEMA